jgi:tetratricopeptide (TPR) repeat protein
MIRSIKFIIAFFSASLLVSLPALAELINQEKFKTHIRWNLNVPKEQIFIVKRDQVLFIETVNLDLFEKLSGEMAVMSPNGEYIENVSYSKDNFPTKPASILIRLKHPSIELFSFYRDADKKYILDFWINSDLAGDRILPKISPIPLPLTSGNKAKKSIQKSDFKIPLSVKKSSVLSVIDASPNVVNEKLTNSDFRDFRYGPSFIWNYQPMIPQLEKDINISVKIPEALFAIKDRVNIDDPKEAHMQLSINFYREGKWGLLNKSITLYERKYNHDTHFVLNEFLKANALLKANLSKPNRGITQSAMLILSNIKDMTKDYELKSAVLRYLIQYHVDLKDFIKTLELSKELYVEARGEFDHDQVIRSALTILHSLAELRQVEKIEVFLKENKKLEAILPPQMGLAYMMFALLAQDDTKELIKRYKLVEKSLAKPVHPAILFNLGESYFRQAEYDLAIKEFDEFLSSYSYLLMAPQARLRLALSYELLDRPADENMVLYKNAIDRSTSPEVRYEAKLRYVGMKILRKYKPTEQDKETEIFLEQSPDETKVMNPNLRKLLWLVRLRLFISTKAYDSALSYLTSIPLDTLRPNERRVFEGDGAEIIYGMIQEAYLKEDYSKVVKIWEVYKDKYETKVAKNLFMNFVVCESFIKLGLFQSFDRAFISLKNVQNDEGRTFPVWVERLKKTNLSEMIEEIGLISLVADANWSKVEARLASYPVSLRDSLSYPFYKGLVYFNQKKYSDAIGEFEKVLIKQNIQNQLTPRQTADLLMGYVESLYQLKDQERFKTVVRALNEDILRSKSAPILNISERINYLLIEAYAGEGNPEWKELETMTKSFREKFQKSPYSSRISYLYGLSLIKTFKVTEGREVFNDLTKDVDVPSHIKEMCRSELATLELIEKKL